MYVVHKLELKYTLVVIVSQKKKKREKKPYHQGLKQHALHCLSPLLQWAASFFPK
jgi:hypothetical protein